MFSRFSKLPSRFVEDYELMLITMDLLGREIRCGKLLHGNCHSVARALAMIFFDFRVADGYVPRLAPLHSDEKYGVSTKLRIHGEKSSFRMRYRRLYHSWLVWRLRGEDTNLIIDPWPVGGGYGFSPPVARFQDPFDIFYVEASFPDMFIESQLEKDTMVCYERIRNIMDQAEPQPRLKPRSKKAA